MDQSVTNKMTIAPSLNLNLPPSPLPSPRWGEEQGVKLFWSSQQDGNGPAKEDDQKEDKLFD